MNEEIILEIEEVQENDFSASVSDGDAVSVTEEIVFVPTVSGGDSGNMSEQLTTLNGTVSAIFFFILCTWVYERIRGGVRKAVNHGKSD